MDADNGITPVKYDIRCDIETPSSKWSLPKQEIPADVRTVNIDTDLFELGF